jgi:hypothetical protein
MTVVMRNVEDNLPAFVEMRGADRVGLKGGDSPRVRDYP